jgi:biopolymer transport protein ExbD
LKQISEINLTPLMDLTFILLITFIITFPLMEQGIPVNLPKGEASDLEPEDSYTVSLDGEGNLYLDDRPVSFKEMKKRLSAARAVSPGASVLVRADRGVVYGRVVEILKVLNEADISNMALVTEPED